MTIRFQADSFNGKAPQRDLADSVRNLSVCFSFAKCGVCKVLALTKPRILWLQPSSASAGGGSDESLLLITCITALSLVAHRLLCTRVKGSAACSRGTSWPKGDISGTKPLYFCFCCPLAPVTGSSNGKRLEIRAEDPLRCGTEHIGCSHRLLGMESRSRGLTEVPIPEYPRSQQELEPTMQSPPSSAGASHVLLLGWDPGVQGKRCSG